MALVRSLSLLLIDALSASFNDEEIWSPASLEAGRPAKARPLPTNAMDPRSAGRGGRHSLADMVV